MTDAVPPPINLGPLQPISGKPPALDVSKLTGAPPTPEAGTPAPIEGKWSADGTGTWSKALQATGNGELEDLGDVSSSETAAARAISDAQATLAKSAGKLTGNDNQSLADFAADQRAVHAADAALKQLEAQQAAGAVPADVYQQYAAQVKALHDAGLQKWGPGFTPKGPWDSDADAPPPAGGKGAINSAR